MRDHIDEVDLQILRMMQEDGRITNADLARRIGLSPPSVLQRVRKLEETGYILGYKANLNPEKLGFSLTVWLQATLSTHQKDAIDEFRRTVKEIPEVLECYNVSGSSDYLMKVAVVNMHAYEELLREKMSKLKHVSQLQSGFVIFTLKDSGFLPI